MTSRKGPSRHTRKTREKSIMRNPDAYPDALVVVFTSVNALIDAVGKPATKAFLLDLETEAMRAVELGRQVVVIDENDGLDRVENRARREFKEAIPTAIWVHFEDFDDPREWNDFESSFPKLLRKAGIGSAKIAAISLDEYVDQVSEIMSAAGVETEIAYEMSP